MSTPPTSARTQCTDCGAMDYATRLAFARRGTCPCRVSSDLDATTVHCCVCHRYLLTVSDPNWPAPVRCGSCTPRPRKTGYPHRSARREKS